MTDKTKVYCNSCKGLTNHNIKSTHDKSLYEEYEDHGQKFLGYYVETEYRFLVCCGCDTATIEEKWTDAGMKDHNGNKIYSYDY